MVKDNLETNAITTKPSHVTELFSWVSLPNCSPLFPNKISCFVSTCVSSDNSFPSVRQEPSLGPWKGSPFLQKSICGHMLNHLNAPALLFFLFPCSENSLPYLQGPILQDFLYTFSSIPGLLPPDSSSILNPHQAIENISRHCQIFHGTEITPGLEPTVMILSSVFIFSPQY